MDGPARGGEWREQETGHAVLDRVGEPADAMRRRCGSLGERVPGALLALVEEDEGGSNEHGGRRMIGGMTEGRPGTR